MFERGLRASPGFWGTRVAGTGSALMGPPVAAGSEVGGPAAIGSAPAGAAASARPSTTRASTRRGTERERGAMP